MTRKQEMEPPAALDLEADRPSYRREKPKMGRIGNVSEKITETRPGSWANLPFLVGLRCGNLKNKPDPCLVLRVVSSLTIWTSILKSRRRCFLPVSDPSRSAKRK